MVLGLQWPVGVQGSPAGVEGLSNGIGAERKLGEEVDDSLELEKGMASAEVLLQNWGGETEGLDLEKWMEG